MGFAPRWTPEQLLDYQKRKAGDQPQVIAAAVKGKVVNAAPRPYRSRLEAEYAGVLELRKRELLLTDYGYERIRLRLPGDVWYTPDFDAIRADGSIELHECKGFMREAARNKLRQAVELYPGFHWFIVGESRTPRRLLAPSDVPAIRKGVK